MCSGKITMAKPEGDTVDYEYPFAYEYDGIPLNGETFPKNILDQVPSLRFESGDLLVASYVKTGNLSGGRCYVRGKQGVVKEYFV